MLNYSVAELRIKKGTFQYFSVLKNLHGIAFLYNFAAEKR